MVNKPTMLSKVGGAAQRARSADVSCAPPAPLAPRPAPPYAWHALQGARAPLKHIRVSREPEAEDVIDLGAPRRAPPSAARTRSAYTPNPRLYPAPPPAKPKRRSEPGGSAGRARRRGKRVFRRPVPNARLYRPAPPPPPPAAPRASWPPPAPAARLDTASRAALRLSEQRRARPAPSPPPRRAPRSRRGSPPNQRAPAPPAPPARRLVVTLPAAAAGEAPRRYRPASEHFRLRSLDAASDESTPAARPRPPAMEPGNRQSTSPEDCSDGNDTLSAPSEFLAEFLSAIMRRQYAEALKYCRLILQYEPHNATARGFYPLLQHKVQELRPADGEWRRGSSSEEASAGSGDRHARAQEQMQQGGDDSSLEPDSRRASHSSRGSEGSSGSQSSLELDSSDALAHTSPSLSLSHRTEHSESAGSRGRCASAASEPDDNGNEAAALPRRDDNDNAPAAKSESAASSLRRLRAQFTCSIK